MRVSGLSVCLSVFSVEMDFTEPYSEVQQRGMQEVLVQRQEIDKLLEKLDARKAMGPDVKLGFKGM